jgi:hypothetical protein
MTRMQNAVKPWRVLVKGLLMFSIMEFTFVSLLPGLEPPNLYAMLAMKRERFPLSTVAPTDDALDVGNLDAMFATHVISNAKDPNEFRVLVLGDSALWGMQLSADQTLSGQLNALQIMCGKRNVRVYNLSYPRSSASKDLMILDKAMGSQPDLILWFVTLYTLAPKLRLDHYLVAQNPAEFYKLGHRFDFLPRGFTAPTLADTLLSRNRTFFRDVRLQLYTLIELATGKDQIPGPPDELPVSLSADMTLEGLRPPTLDRRQLSLDQVRDFYLLAAQTPVILINEPMLIVTGDPNSDLRYNGYYPRWVYDQYREYLADDALAQNWNYLDLWNAIPAAYFAGTPLHLDPPGQHLLAETIAPAIEKACP